MCAHARSTTATLLTVNVMQQKEKKEPVYMKSIARENSSTPNQLYNNRLKYISKENSSTSTNVIF